jgi:tetratricopeptide (TPR) repeat protein
MAYGRSLDFSGHWALAAALYETVLAHVDVARDGDLATGAQFRLAYCRRVLGQLDEAEVAYAAAGRLAADAHDVVGTLRSEVGLAKVIMARGNVPSAERMLDDVIARTDEALRARDDGAMREFRATVLHDRAVLAFVREEHERGIALLDLALADTTSPSARDRVIADIALGFMHLGVRSAARDAFLIVAATAEEQYSRWSATVNLLQLAVEDGMEPAFEQYRRQLAGQPLTPEQATDFHHIAATGLRRFGRLEQARTALAEGIALAERHGLNALLFKLERERETLEAGKPVERRRAAEPPPGVAGVATAMRELRERVLVPASR